MGIHRLPADVILDEVTAIQASSVSPTVPSPGQVLGVVVGSTQIWTPQNWADMAPVFASYTPVITQGANTPTFTQTQARSMTIGKWRFVEVRLIPTSVGIAGSAIIVTLPSGAINGPANKVLGSAQVRVAGVTYPCICRTNTAATPNVNFVRTDTIATGNLGVDPSAALAATADFIDFQIAYELA